MDTIILGQHLRAIAEFSRRERTANLEAKKDIGWIAPTGFAKELQDYIEQLPHLGAEASGRGLCGLSKRFRGCWLLVNQQEDLTTTPGTGETIIDELQPIAKYCLKHKMGAFIRINGYDLEIAIVWEKPLLNNWFYHAKPKNCLVPYPEDNSEGQQRSSFRSRT